MKKKKKNIIVIISIVICIAIGMSIAAMVLLLPVKGTPNSEFWLSKQEYKLEDTIVMQKEKDKDFKILNLTDIQLNDFLDIGQTKFTKQTIEKVIDQEKPDLITLTGDQVWAAFTKQSVKWLIKTMESFNIPWAPVMGNHDGEGNANIDWIADRYVEAKNCIFKKGPNNIGGIGNYVINIVEEGKIVQSLIMMDSHSGRTYQADPDKTNPHYKYDEVINDKGEKETIQIGHDYDFITETQISWYKWAINGAKALNNGVIVESTTFFHIALPEYYDAYMYWKDNNFDSSIGFGKKNEDVCSAKVNSGFFDVMKELGSTKNVVVGHDHINNFSVMYQGIRLSYGLKTGNRSYTQDGLNGGTVITIGDKVSVEHKFITK